MKKTFVSAAQLEQIAAQYPTPFHIYDEQGILENARRLNAAFSWNPGFREYFAVKATPTPAIMKVLQEGRRFFGGIPILGMPFKSGRPATRLLLKNVCLTHMDGTENHSLNDLLPHASATSNNAATRTDTNQVLRGSSRGGQCHGGSKAKGLL